MGYKSVTLNKSLSITQLVMVYCLEYSSDFLFQGESHDFFELLYVDNGAVEIKTDNDIFYLEKGSFFLHAPNEFHALKAYQNSSPTLVNISFFCENAELLSPLFKHGIRALSDEKAIIGKLVTEAEGAFSNQLNIPSHMLRKSKNAPFGAEQMVLIYLEQLLIGLVRHHTTPGFSYSALMLDKALPETQSSYVNEVLRYLSDNIGQSLTIEQICRDNKIGRSRIQELFHREFACGIIEYFSLMKANAAKSLLRSGDKSIGEIAELLGYSSQAYFSKQFKAVFSRTPTQYRQAVAQLTKKISKAPPKR